jgi:GT2 family glycosyltransferase
MRVLAHIHTFNDAAVIQQALEGLQRQTRPPDAILIVDNASTDGTLDRTFPDNVTIIRNPENLGTSGTVRVGFAYAVEHGFDWAWILDADSVPEPDALENLLAFFERLPPAKQEHACFLAARSQTVTGEIKEQPISLAGAAIRSVPITTAERSTECDCVLWSGSLYRTAAVARIGPPAADYVIDFVELDYGYRARQLGFTSYIVHNSVVRHDVGRSAGTTARLYRFGPISITSIETSPLRTYYSSRNMIYFLLYQYKPRRITWAVHQAAWRVASLTLNFVLRPRDYGAQIVACFRGIWHGVTGNMAARY